MARDLILHIGTTKTGSTSIQRVLAGARPALRAQGVYYPTTPGDSQHDLLAYALMENHAQRDRLETSLWNGMAPAARVERFFREFEAEMRALPEDVRQVVISTEFIYILLRRPSEVQRLHDLLAPHFARMRVVVYLRRQDAHFTSLYTQLLRSGEVLPPGALKMQPRPLHELDYAALLGRWAAIFGQDAIFVRLFDRQADGSRFDAVQDFLHLIGVTLPDTSGGAGESNQSVDLSGQTLLADLGQMIQARDKVRIVASPDWKLLTDAVTSACPGRGWRPTREAAEAFYADFADGNETVRARWFPDLARLFTEDFSDYPDAPMQVDEAALYQAALRTLIAITERERQRDVRQAMEAVRKARAANDESRLRAALQRVLRMDGSHVGLRVELAELLLAAGETARAQNALNAARAIDPEHQGVRRLAARLGGQAGGKKGKRAGAR